MNESEVDVEPEEADDEDADDEWTRFEAFSRWLNRQQWTALVVLAVGVLLLFYDRTASWIIMGAAVALAGLFPVVTGIYHGPFGAMRGWKARARGLVSVALGAFVIALALSSAS